MVFVAGEAGIGKTRLAEELLLHVQRQGHVAVRARAYALEGRLAYAPLADWLRTHAAAGEPGKARPGLAARAGAPAAGAADSASRPACAGTLDRTLAAEAPL